MVYQTRTKLSSPNYVGEVDWKIKWGEESEGAVSATLLSPCSCSHQQVHSVNSHWKSFTWSLISLHWLEFKALEYSKEDIKIIYSLNRVPNICFLIVVQYGETLSLSLQLWNFRNFANWACTRYRVLYECLQLQKNIIFICCML